MKNFFKALACILTRTEQIKLCLLALLDLATGLLDIAFLAMLLMVINFYTGKSSANPLQSFFNSKSLLLAAVFLIAFALKNWLGYRAGKVQNFFFFSVASRLSERNLLYYFNGGYANFINVDSSVYIRKISQQPIEFSSYILINLQQIISQGILVLLTLTAMLFYHSSLFFLLFLLLTPPVLALGFFIKRKLRTLRLGIQTTSQLTLQHLKESLAGYLESNVYLKNIFFTTRYHRHQRDLNNYIATQQTLQGLPFRMVEVFAVSGLFILIGISKLPGFESKIALIDVGVFMAAAYKIIPGMVKILNSIGQIKTYGFTLKDLAETRPEISDKATISQAGQIRSLAFVNVGFSYKNRRVIERLNFKVLPGDFIGLSGRSGLGKTTIINLLLGFLTPDEGDILINNSVANSLDRQLYWSRISVVKQQAFFTNDTLLKNITLNDAGYDQLKLKEAIEFCGIDAMLTGYAGGFGTMVTENGKNFSGGQQQRIMLARALYHDFDLLILDEPFGELDDEAEQELLLNLQQLAAMGKMIIMITHHKDSLSFCNKIISLDEEYA